MSALRGPAVLFCPGDRPDRYAKALRAADSVIVDLEDAVAPGGKDDARRSVAQAFADGVLDPARTMVRVNPPDTDAGRADLQALAGTAITTVVLPKAERPEDVAGLAPLGVLAICESARGVLAAEALAAVDNCVGLMWGAEDLVASLGGRSSRDEEGRYRRVVEHARATTLLAARAHGRVALDGVYLAIADTGGLAAEAADSVASGYQAKAAIHPSQVSVIRSAFAPTPEQVAWARRVLAAVDADTGVVAHDGLMVDEPVLVQARTVLAAFEAGEGAADV